MKICSKCGEEKEEGEFIKNKKECKKCKYIDMKKYYEKNKEKLSTQKKEYYKNHKEYCKKRCKEYREKNKEYYKEYHKEYNKNDKNKIRTKKNKKCIDIICLQCGKHTKGWKGDNTKFCSNECKFVYKTGENSNNWMGGLSWGEYCPKFNDEFKRRVRAFFDFECFMCGKDEKENISNASNGKLKIKNLSVHHVCYNKRACCDDTPRYFVPLCLKHHSMTNGKKSRDRWEEMFKRCLLEMYDGRSFYTKEEFEARKNERTINRKS